MVDSIITWYVDWFVMIVRIVDRPTDWWMDLINCWISRFWLIVRMVWLNDSIAQFYLFVSNLLTVRFLFFRFFSFSFFFFFMSNIARLKELERKSSPGYGTNKHTHTQRESEREHVKWRNSQKKIDRLIYWLIRLLLDTLTDLWWLLE